MTIGLMCTKFKNLIEINNDSKNYSLPNGRILWMDFAKMLCIGLVVFGHMPIKYDALEFIYAFHVPLFFFVSGCLDKNLSIKEQAMKSARTLLVPYIFLYLINYIGWVFLVLPKNPTVFGEMSIENTVFKPMLGMLFGNGYHTPYSTMVCPLWFIIALFNVKIFHSFLLVLTKGNKKLYLIWSCLAPCIALLLKIFDFELYFSLDSSLIAFPFFGLGYLTAKKMLPFFFSNPTSRKRLLYFLLGICLSIVLYNLSPANGIASISSDSYGNNIGLFYIFGLSGILLIILLSQFYVKPLKIVTIVSTGTLLILAFHLWIMNSILRLAGMRSYDMPDGISYDVFTGIWVSASVLLIFYYPIIIVLKYFPFLLGKKKTCNL